MFKKIVIVLVVLLVIVAGGAWYLLSQLDSVVKGAIEKYGSEATQSSVTVESVKLSLATGEGTISGLIVGNPDGYATANALTLGSITVKVDTASVAGGGPIVIKEIDIVAPHVTYEEGVGGSNLKVIQRNTQAYAERLVGASGTSTGKPARKLIIQDLYVRDGQVGVSATILQGRSLTAPLPEIHLTDIGKDSGGATPAEVARLVFGTISKDAGKVGAKALANFATSAVTGVAHGVTGGAKGVGKTVKGLFGN